MKIKKTLNDLVRVVVDEAERNPEFSRQIEEALGFKEKSKKQTIARAAHRRAPSAIDPVELAKKGEAALRVSLATLNIEQLKDVVAEYGMDPGKAVLKWKSAEKITDRIVEMSIGRAKKGEGFLTSGTPVSEK